MRVSIEPVIVVNANSRINRRAGTARAATAHASREYQPCGGCDGGVSQLL
jgi:hypothetical protein